MITRRGFMKVLGGGFASAMALGGYAFAFEPLVRLRIAHYGLTPPGWTPGLKLRVVALADLHACEPWMSVNRIAAICRKDGRTFSTTRGEARGPLDETFAGYKPAMAE